MANMLSFAKEELRRLRSLDGKPDEMQDAIEANVLGMVELFAAGGHSGSSAAYTLGILEKVLAFKPVTPLTGEADEWTAVDSGYDMVAQNKRCFHVFKRADGTAYDINAVIFRDPDGSTWSGSDGSRDVTFPYMPKTEIVDRQPEVA